jgi:hypothetical protein
MLFKVCTPPGELPQVFAVPDLATVAACRLVMLHILGVWPELAPQLFLSANKATTIGFDFAEAQALSANYNINLGSFYYAQKK